MSATIATKDLKFVIFGSGHDYTRLDSGKGDTVFFSHPYVPKGSVNYAGQYYFLVPDEDGNMIDAVMDDVAHCTFTPAIGSTFSAEGETDVSVYYYREYIHDDETIVVEKTLTQTIEVVDHGNIATAGGYVPAKTTWCNADIYDDGYCFMRPKTTSDVEYTYQACRQSNTIKKLSSMPWRINKLGNGTNGFVNSSGLVDISELAFADTSNVTVMTGLFQNVTSLTDWSALSKWNTSNVTQFDQLFTYSAPPNLSFSAGWDTSKVTNMRNAFYNFRGTSIEGVENWDVSNVTTMEQLFVQSINLTSLQPLRKWNTSKVTNLYYAFGSCSKLTSLDGLQDWDVSKVTSMASCFYNDNKLTSLLPLLNWNPKPTSCNEMFNNCYGLLSYKGVDNFDLSNCTNCNSMFNNTPKVKKLEGLESWDVSKVQNFGSMFGQGHWIESLYPIRNWDFSSMTNASSMFGQNGALLDVEVDWTLPVGATISGMFTGMNYYYSTKLGKYVWENATSYVDWEGNSYGKGSGVVWDAEHPLQQMTKDASGAENWTSGSSRGAFNNVWTDTPSWN